MTRITLSLGLIVALVGCAQDRAEQGGEGPNPVVASVTFDGSGGSLEYGPLTLVVPPGALTGSTTLTLREVERGPRGAVGPAWEFGPDGLMFAVPATLKVYYDVASLPAGTDPHALRLSVFEGGLWQALEDHVNRRADGHVVGTIRHFSTYGLVADPRESDGTGTRWEANGVVVESSRDAWGRLYVSPTGISLFIDAGAAGPLTLVISGLPTDEANHLYVDDYGTHMVVEPSAGGVATVDVDAARPHFLWLQPRPGTIFIGGPGDQCHLVGVRVDDTCTLTRDVLGAVSIETSDQELDCAGHRIEQNPGKPETGIGILVSGLQRPMANVKIRNCVVGGPAAGFFQAVDVASAPNVQIADTVFEENQLGIYVQGSRGARILRNRFIGSGNYAIQLYQGCSVGEVADNEVAFAGGFQPTAIMLKGGQPGSSTSHTVRMKVARNRILGGDIGIRLIEAVDNEFTENDIDRTGRALWIGPGGWPNRFWWNNINDWSAWGVWSEIGPAELSDAGHGNWWGRACPAAPFMPGVDGNRSDVVDSHPYGQRSGWDAGETPNCGRVDHGPTCPTNANHGADGVIWQDYTPRSPSVSAAWESLQATILSNEAAHDLRARQRLAEDGLNLAAAPLLPPIVLWNKDTDNPRLIVGRMTSLTTADAHAVVRGFLHRYVDLFGANSPAGTLTDLRLETSFVGRDFTFFTFRQYVGSVPIVNEPMRFAVAKDGSLVYYFGHYFPDARVDWSRAGCNRNAAARAAESEYVARFGGARAKARDVTPEIYATSVAGVPSFFGAWTGRVESSDVAAVREGAFFIVYDGDCTVRAMGRKQSAGYVAGAVLTKWPNSRFAAFGAPPHPDLRYEQIWVEDIGDPLRLTARRSSSGGINETDNLHFRSTASHVYASDTCTIAGLPHFDEDVIDGPCWHNREQGNMHDLSVFGCHPINPGTAACDAMYSDIECTAAFARIKDAMRWYARMDLGLTEGRLPFDWNLDLVCNDRDAVDEGGYYKIPLDVTAAHRIHLQGFTTLSTHDLGGIDHQWTHHLEYTFLKANSVIDGCCGTSFDDDAGQSDTIGEALCDYFPDGRNRQDPGVYYRRMPGGSTAPYPSQGLNREACAGPPGDECSRPRVAGCYRIIVGLACPDDYVWAAYPVYEPGSTDTHAYANGKVLYQSLADFRERFGSVRFDPSHGYAGATTFPARILLPTGPSPMTIDRDWGVSHALDPIAAPLIGCEETPCGTDPVCGWERTCYQHVRLAGEPHLAGVGDGGHPQHARMLVSFADISLPSNGRLTVGVLRLPDYDDVGNTWRFEPGAVEALGPVEFVADRDGFLFSTPIPVSRDDSHIDIAAVWTVRPAARLYPAFRVSAYRHYDGGLADRLVAYALWLSTAWIDWYDFRANVFAADRLLNIESPMGLWHQGWFFQDAFDGHGVNTTLDDWCDDCPCSCHESWYCWLTRFFGGC